MAEQRDHGQPEENPAPGSGANLPGPPQLPQPGSTAAPAPLPPQGGAEPLPQPSAPNLPQPAGNGSAEPAPQLDPDQLRQFQEFQRFQEYLRFSQAQQGMEPAPQPDAGLVPAGNRQPAPLAGGAQPPAPPNQPGALAPYEEPPRNRRPVPHWVKRLGGKILGWVVVALLLYLGGSWLYHRIFPSDDGKTTEQVAAEGGGRYRTNHVYSKSPYEAVRMFYQNISQNVVKDACGRLQAEPGNDAQSKFARDFHQPDCPAAVEWLHAKVTNVQAYGEASIPSYLSGQPQSGTVTIDSCQFAIQGGPALGTFQVTKVPLGQWLITGHTPGPEKCGPPTATSTPG